MPVRFGPILVDQHAETMRSSAPASTGVATIRPFSAGVEMQVLAIDTPSGPSSTQTMKLRSK